MLSFSAQAELSSWEIETIFLSQPSNKAEDLIREVWVSTLLMNHGKKVRTPDPLQGNISEIVKSNDFTIYTRLKKSM